MPDMPRKENTNGFAFRPGQQAAIDFIIGRPDLTVVPLKLPGGYGKTIVIAECYRIKRDQGVCDRLLIVVANDRQRSQIITDFEKDCHWIGLDIPGGVWAFSPDGATAGVHLRDQVEVFVTTIQSVSATKAKPCTNGEGDKAEDKDALTNLLKSKGKWMLAADEYHHYATEQDWGKSLKRVVDISKFTVALSATPSRDGMPTIFGDPIISWSYREGVGERSLKTLKVASYNYGVEVTTGKGKKLRFTSDELREIEKLPGGINTFQQREGLRYDIRYVHPVILEPLLRLSNLENATGFKFQMLIRAMSCAHARALCEQLRELQPNRVIEWVGTGPDGRGDAENDEICERFVPPKNGQGRRPDSDIDVLIQVGMAGEGFDCINVTEIVDLSLATLMGSANATKQFYKRGARWIHGSDPEHQLDPEHQICTINVPSDHPLSGLGQSVMDWIDSNNGIPGFEPDPPSDPNTNKPKPKSIPDEWLSDIIDSVKLLEVRMDDPGFQRYTKTVEKVANINREDPEAMEFLRKMYQQFRDESTPKPSAQMQMARLRTKIANVVSDLALRTARNGKNPQELVDSKITGSFQQRINGHLKQIFGPRDNLLVEGLVKQARYLASIYNQTLEGDYPLWLYQK